MKDAQFEHISRAHLFWQEWQAAADRSGDPDTYPLSVTDSQTDMDFAMPEDEKNQFRTQMAEKICADAAIAHGRFIKRINDFIINLT